MRVKMLNAETFEELNIRHTDEIAEDYDLSDSQSDEMENELRRAGRYWLGAGETLPAVYLQRA